MLKKILLLPLAAIILTLYPAVNTTAGETTKDTKTATQPTATKDTTKPADEKTKAKSEADKKQTYFDEFVDKIQKGGIVMLILLGLSVIGIGKILERLFNLSEATMATPGLSEKADQLFKEKKFDELTNVCRNDKSILARIILSIVEHRECPRADVQSIADDIGSRELRIQMQKAYPLAFIAKISPLLGLFGTVIGMIGAFDTVAQAGDMGNAAILADDIAKALVTTGGGLAVAIPMLWFYNFFRGRTNRYAVILEEESGELFSAWFLRSRPAAETSVPAEKPEVSNVEENAEGTGNAF